MKSTHLFEKDETLLIPGVVGQIEIATHIPENDRNITAVICHPHPVFGGTMENKVVTTIARSFKSLDIHAIRFNFRGVGKSAGSFADAIGESDDLRAVLNWVIQHRPNDQLILAGFSFGSYISANVAHEYPIKQLISIAPAVTHYEFRKISPPNCPWLIIQGEEDEVVASQYVYEFVDEKLFPIELIKIKKASHFFHGKLIELKDVLITYINNRFPR